MVQFIAGARRRREVCQRCAGDLLQDSPPSSPAWSPPTQAASTEAAEITVDRPTEIHLPDWILVRDLSGLLHVKPFQIIDALMKNNVFKGLSEAIDFATASIVCRHFGVTPYRKTEGK